MELRLKISISPSQQQTQSSLNQESKNALNQNMGWEDSGATHPHKEKNDCKLQLGLRLFFKKVDK